MGVISKTIGERLRRRRTDLGYSQEYTSELAGVHPTYIGQVERGEKNLTVESLEKICSALDYPMNELFYHIQPAAPTYEYAQKSYDLIMEQPAAAQKELYHILETIINYKKS